MSAERLTPAQARLLAQCASKNLSFGRWINVAILGLVNLALAVPLALLCFRFFSQELEPATKADLQSLLGPLTGCLLLALMGLQVSWARVQEQRLGYRLAQRLAQVDPEFGQFAGAAAKVFQARSSSGTVDV